MTHIVIVPTDKLNRVGGDGRGIPPQAGDDPVAHTRWSWRGCLAVGPHLANPKGRGREIDWIVGGCLCSSIVASSQSNVDKL